MDRDKGKEPGVDYKYGEELVEDSLVQDNKEDTSNENSDGNSVEENIETVSGQRRKDTEEGQFDFLYLMPIGLALGTVFGDMLFGNMTTGMIIGLIFGLLVGNVLNSMRKKQ